ncbi:UvrB/UvrC motif-containing protein [Sphingobium sp. B2]|uniref:UvrB/UvrC motif-containing protein n=1 Tax=Sphingobium sp. B2 TaxID=2583228 RepID=UPI0028F45E66|nr:UvrB/UvrC motif-containing protein [Sphingobium sp. B2]
MLPKSRITRYIVMTDTLETLRARMDAAARALDFEEAKRLRDMISLIRNGATAVDAEQADLSGIERQQPGAMGLGTNRQRVSPLPGWKPPLKPDPMTSGKSSRRGRRGT